MNPALPKDDKLNNARKSGARILVVTGASGGHIFPALGFLGTLKDRHLTDVLLVLPKKSIINQKENFSAEGARLPDGQGSASGGEYKVRYISISSIKLSLDFKNLSAVLKFFKGVIESIFILSEFKPHIVVGFGSIVCVPLVIIARIFGIKTLIHEQNVIPGRANRLLAYFSDRIAISFTDTRDYFRHAQKKIVFTGNPMRKGLAVLDRKKALDFFGFSDTKFTILIIGGSQGSHRINCAFLEAVSKMPQNSKLQIIHLCGDADRTLLQNAYKDSNVNSRIFSFLDSMQYAYSAADLIVSRAGATTITEIIFFGIPAIIIPYPYAYKHQIANAKILEKKQTAFIISDDALGTDILRQAIADLMDNPDKLKAMRLRYEGFSKTDPNAAFTESVLSLN